MPLAWGRYVTLEFRLRLAALCTALEFNASDLMACIAFETGRTFRANTRNAAGSGAIGLIQFMPQTAVALGTSSDALAAMSATDQLFYVEKYFRPWKGRIHNLESMYMAILWPVAVPMPSSFVLFDQADPKHPRQYVQNRGLDFNRDGKITKLEATARVRLELHEGLKPEHAA